MVNEQIGSNAGILWNILHAQDDKMEVTKLKKESALADADFWSAIGWLAREEKLAFSEEKKGKRTCSFVALK